MANEIDQAAAEIKDEEASPKKSSKTDLGWVGLAAAIAGAASGTPAGTGIANGLSKTWKAQIDDSRKRDMDKAERYEQALFTMKMKGQEERIKAYKEKEAAWNSVMSARTSNDPLDAAIRWGKMQGFTPDETFKKMAVEYGYTPGKDGTKGQVKNPEVFFNALDKAYQAFKDTPAPSRSIDNYATLKYRDTLDRGGMFSGMREMFGVSDASGPLTPYAGAQALANEYYAEQDKLNEADAKAEQASREAFSGVGSILEVIPGKKTLGEESGIKFEQFNAVVDGKDVRYEVPTDAKTGEYLGQPYVVVDNRTSSGRPKLAESELKEIDATFKQKGISGSDTTREIWRDAFRQPVFSTNLQQEVITLLDKNEDMDVPTAVEQVFSKYNSAFMKPEGEGWEVDDKSGLIVLKSSKKAVSFKPIGN